MKITRSPTRLLSILTADGDLDMLTLYQVKRLAEPASGEALRKGSAEIVNADIHASAGILLSKLERAIAEATKEFFVPVTHATELSTSIQVHIGGIINATADDAYIEFYVPHDFSSITEAVVARQSKDTATHRLNYSSRYGALTESSQTHNESLADQEVAETASVIYEQDISGILASLAGGDYVCIKVLGDATNTPDDLILGVRFKYS